MLESFRSNRQVGNGDVPQTLYKTGYQFITPDGNKNNIYFQRFSFKLFVVKFFKFFEQIIGNAALSAAIKK